MTTTTQLLHQVDVLVVLIHLIELVVVVVVGGEGDGKGIS